jgi:hypothetical protein
MPYRRWSKSASRPGDGAGGGISADDAWRLRVGGLVEHPRSGRFYQRHGFVPVERTDGAGNEEREPDVRYQWRPVTAYGVG